MENKTLIFVIVATLFMVGNVDAGPRRRWLERLMEREQLAAASDNNAAVGSAGSGTNGSGASASAGAGADAGGGSGIYGTRYEPFRIERINRGVSTILNGVRMGSLEEILRGSFMFTRNNNVRDVSDSVISSVFGTPVRNEGNLDANGQQLVRGGGSAVNIGASGSTSTNSRG